MGILTFYISFSYKIGLLSAGASFMLFFNFLTLTSVWISLSLLFYLLDCELVLVISTAFLMLFLDSLWVNVFIFFYSMLLFNAFSFWLDFNFSSDSRLSLALFSIVLLINEENFVFYFELLAFSCYTITLVVL